MLKTRLKQMAIPILFVYSNQLKKWNALLQLAIDLKVVYTNALNIQPKGKQVKFGGLRFWKLQALSTVHHSVEKDVTQNWMNN